MKNGRLFGEVWRFMQFVVIVLADVMTVCAHVMIVSSVAITVCTNAITVHHTPTQPKSSEQG